MSRWCGLLKGVPSADSQLVPQCDAYDVALAFSNGQFPRTFAAESFFELSEFPEGRLAKPADRGKSVPRDFLHLLHSHRHPDSFDS
jgi:hypothetical protein